jgi:hypothetical protein
MLGDPASWPEAWWTCMFCDSIKTNRNEIVQHLLLEHKIHTCTNKSSAHRTFARKDKLKQHLQQVHNLSDNSVGWEALDPCSEKEMGLGTWPLWCVFVHNGWCVCRAGLFPYHFRPTPHVFSPLLTILCPGEPRVKFRPIRKAY